MNHRDPELVYDGPIPPAIREQMRRQGTPEQRRRVELMHIRDSSYAAQKRIEGLLDVCDDEMRETFLNIEHRYHCDRVASAEIFLRRLK